MRLQQAAEFEKCDGIGRGFAIEVNSNKATDSLAVIESVFCPFIGRTKELLHHIHAQHPLQTDQQATATSAAGVDWGQSDSPEPPKE